MKTQVRFIVILAAILAMALAYLGGTVVSAQRALIGPAAPALTNPQWATLQAANLLLLEDDGESTYLPLLMKQ